MDRIHIPHDAWVLVGDGRKALFLRNDGDEKFPNLMTEQVFEHDNPPTHEQGTDRPGRGFKRAHTNRRSSMETTDWHQIEADRFTRQVAAALEKLVRERKVGAIVLAAPPHTLAELRHALNDDVKRRVVAEVDKDLTKHPVWEIEKHILA